MRIAIELRNTVRKTTRAAVHSHDRQISARYGNWKQRQQIVHDICVLVVM